MKGSNGQGGGWRHRGQQAEVQTAVGNAGYSVAVELTRGIMSEPVVNQNPELVQVRSPRSYG